MKPEAQRIAIAEACGWTHEIWSDGVTKSWIVPSGELGYGALGYGTPPDYLTDLNAMHEAEKVLTLEQQGQYTTALADVCREVGVWAEGSQQILNWYWHATAAQRAEAFLKCIGKWESHEA